MRTRLEPAWFVALAGVSLLLLVGCRRLQRTSTAEKLRTSVVHLETFVLNAGDSEAHSFLRIGIDLVVQASQESGSEPFIETMGNSLFDYLSKL